MAEIELYPTIEDNRTTGTIPNSSSLYSTTIPALPGEIDLRAEIKELLYGSNKEIAKGQIGLLRRMRLDSNEKKILCTCVDELTHEPDKDTFCPICFGEGFLWDEEYITFYKVVISSSEGLVRKDDHLKGGISNIPYSFFYVEYFVNPTRYDKLIELEKDLEGGVSRYRRVAAYNISFAEDFRSDSGRVEYWRLATVKDSVVSTWEI